MIPMILASVIILSLIIGYIFFILYNNTSSYDKYVNHTNANEDYDMSQIYKRII